MQLLSTIIAACACLTILACDQKREISPTTSSSEGGYGLTSEVGDSGAAPTQVSNFEADPPLTLHFHDLLPPEVAAKLGQSAPGSGYAISIAATPDWLIPGEHYTIVVTDHSLASEYMNFGRRLVESTLPSVATGQIDQPILWTPSEPFASYLTASQSGSKNLHLSIFRGSKAAIFIDRDIMIATFVLTFGTATGQPPLATPDPIDERETDDPLELSDQDIEDSDSDEVQPTVTPESPSTAPTVVSSAAVRELRHAALAASAERPQNAFTYLDYEPSTNSYKVVDVATGDEPYKMYIPKTVVAEEASRRVEQEGAKLGIPSALYGTERSSQKMEAHPLGHGLAALPCKHHPDAWLKAVPENAKLRKFLARVAAEVEACL